MTGGFTPFFVALAVLMALVLLAVPGDAAAEIAPGHGKLTNNSGT